MFQSIFTTKVRNYFDKTKLSSIFLFIFEQNEEKAFDVTHVIDSNLGMYAGDVDLSDFSDKEIEEFIQPYGYTIRKDSRDSVERMYGDSWKQICCECIFEQLMFSDYRLDC